MQRKTLLLDFDGVVFKNHKLHKVVANRCEQFMHKYVKVRDQETLTRCNKSLYETTGHTLLGLQRLGYNITFEDFNNYVYKDIDFKNNLKDISEEHVRDIHALKKIQKHCEVNNYGLYIFSNAPDIWCDSICEILLGYSVPSTYIYTNNILKPNPYSYIRVQQYCDSDEYIFVDDKLGNLLNVPVNGRWTCMWLNGCETKKINSRLFFIESLDDMLSLDVV
jgi:FMN phosphatase YigB (HAD superfamily)